MREAPARARVRLRWAAASGLGIAVAIGVTALLAATASFPGGSLAAIPAGLLSGWSALALLESSVVAVRLWRMDAADTQAHATAEDPGRRIARLTAIVGSIVSLGAVVVVMVQARAASGTIVFILAALSLLSVAASWLLIQVNYTLHYARVYYEADPAGAPRAGINFNQTDPPEYTDFAYFSIGLGLTYQVSDTDVTRNAIRRIVIAQSLLAYLFGAGILAVVINLVSGLG